jgi:phage terminase large subunit GpA-like protein
MELYRWLKLEWPTDKDIEAGVVFPPGSCHFPQYGEEYFKQLTAERRVIRFTKVSRMRHGRKTQAATTKHWIAVSMPVPPPRFTV